jgi:hypothetical protein
MAARGLDLRDHIAAHVFVAQLDNVNYQNLLDP